MSCEPEKIKIIYNPYAKTIAYKRWSNKTWLDLGSSSPLNEVKYQKNITLQNLGVEIIHHILRGYDDGTIGVNLVFEGTDNDYNDFQSIIDLYFSDQKITCEQDPHKLLSADEAAQKIESIFESTERTFQKYPNNELKLQIEKYKEAVKSTVTVCVLGTYSAGKSAFINALIGEEILPCASDPTTATAYRVHTSMEKKIRFFYKEEVVELQFDGNDYKPNADRIAGDLLLQTIKDKIKNSEIHSWNAHMYYALEEINSFTKNAQSNKDTTNSPTIIDVYVPFSKSILPLDAYDFIFVDTPGADSETFKEHLKVTKQALEHQTSGLAIIITKPDDMDKAGNALVNNLLENYGGALDFSNTIVVVNQADDKTPKTLQEKKEKIKNLCIARWHSNRIFFVSAAMAIAGKKDNVKNDEAWIDGDLYLVYEEKQRRFEDPNHKFYTQLYYYNIVPDNRLKELQRLADSAPQSEKMLYNSGIRSIENEISLFAQKYAAYNKCTQAQQYLQQAIEIAEKLTEQAERKANELESELNLKIDTKTNSLSGQLKIACEKLKAEVSENAANYIREHAPSTDKIENLKGSLEEVWGKIKKNKEYKGKKDKIEALNQYIEEKYNIAIKDYFSNLEDVVKSNASQAEAQSKDALCKVVNESAYVQPSEKNKLNHIILNYPKLSVPRHIKLKSTVPIKHKFLIFEWENEEKLTQKNMQQFVDEQFEQERTQYSGVYLEKYQNNLQQWIDALKCDMIANLPEFNSALRKLNDALQEKMIEKENLKAQHDLLLSNGKTIANLLHLDADK